MPKLCSCFKSNNDDRKKNKQTDKDIDIKSNGKQNTGFDVLLLGKSFLYLLTETFV